MGRSSAIATEPLSPTSAPASVLVVEDEPSIADSVLYALRTEGFDPVHADSLTAARQRLSERSYGAFILDVTLPDGNGFDLCRELVRISPVDIPILFLTARDSEVDRILGLELGRGDYMTKPFSPRELTVRLRNLIAARRPPTPPNHRPVLSLSKDSPTHRPTDPPQTRLFVDIACGLATLDGIDLDLSPSECRILAALISARGRVLSRDHLLNAISDQDGAALDRVIDSHIKNLRRKFKRIDPHLDAIHTKRGFGYALTPALLSSRR